MNLLENILELKNQIYYNALDVYKEENILYFFLIFYEKFLRIIK